MVYKPVLEWSAFFDGPISEVSFEFLALSNERPNVVFEEHELRVALIPGAAHYLLKRVAVRHGLTYHDGGELFVVQTLLAVFHDGKDDLTLA